MIFFGVVLFISLVANTYCGILSFLLSLTVAVPKQGRTGDSQYIGEQLGPYPRADSWVFYAKNISFSM